MTIEVNIMPLLLGFSIPGIGYDMKVTVPVCAKFNNMSRFILIFTIFMVVVGCNDCRYYAKEFEKRQFVIIVQMKYIHDYKQIAFEGVDLGGKAVLFDEVGFRDLYDMVKVGDTLKKELGTADIKIFRKDTSLICRWYCNGQIVE